MPKTLCFHSNLFWCALLTIIFCYSAPQVQPLQPIKAEVKKEEVESKVKVSASVRPPTVVQTTPPQQQPSPVTIQQPQMATPAPQPQVIQMQPQTPPQQQMVAMKTPNGQIVQVLYPAE